jgi:hypothetical protein
MPTRDGRAVDHTGQPYAATARTDDRRLPHQSIMKNPKLLSCPNCEKQHFYIVADDSDHGAAGLVQFRCATPRCPTVWPELQIQKPQMTDAIERMHPQANVLWVPPVDFEIDVPR